MEIFENNRNGTTVHSYLKGCTILITLVSISLSNNLILYIKISASECQNFLIINDFFCFFLLLNILYRLTHSAEYAVINVGSLN